MDFNLKSSPCGFLKPVGSVLILKLKLMEKSKEELLKYSIEMRLRGDTYRDMLAYLQRWTNDDKIIKEIIATVDKLEKEQKISTPKYENSASIVSIVLGLTFIIGGIALIFVLWNKGFVASLPIILIVIGFGALSGRMG